MSLKLFNGMRPRGEARSPLLRSGLGSVCSLRRGPQPLRVTLGAEQLLPSLFRQPQLLGSVARGLALIRLALQPGCLFSL